MEPSIIIIGLIVIAVIVVVILLRSRSGSDSYLSSPHRPRPSVSAAANEEDDPPPTTEARGWGSKEEDLKSAPPQQAPVQRGGYPTGGMTGPSAASGGYPLPPLPPTPVTPAEKPDNPAWLPADNPDEDDRFVPQAPGSVKPINPPPLPPLQPQQPTAPSQWQNAEPPAAMNEETAPPPPPIPQLEMDDDEIAIPLEPSKPEPAKTAPDDEPFGSQLEVEREASPGAPPASPITRGREREEAELEAAPPTPEPEPIAAAPKSEVNFTAFYPRTAQATRRYGLYIYAHLPTALNTIQTDAQKFTTELGGNVPAPRTTKQPAQIADGQPITITPECDGLTFDPPTLTKRWDSPYVRYEFDFKAIPEQIGDELQGRAMIAVAGIEVAQLKFTIEVVALEESTTQATTDNAIAGETQPTQPPSMKRVMGANNLVPPPNNPLAAAKTMAQSEPTKMYAKIFISYSRKDKAVAEAYRLAQMALGNDVFMDTYSIRTGEDWRVALARAIDSADVFQLFWSENAAASENVRDEWDYALHYRCPDSKCADFIRPVYWKPPSPIPNPPAELSHLNFRFVPLIQD